MVKTALHVPRFPLRIQIPCSLAMFICIFYGGNLKTYKTCKPCIKKFCVNEPAARFNSKKNRKSKSDQQWLISKHIKF